MTKGTWLVVMVCALAARGADFFVATNGSDSAAGSAAQPFRSIQKALDAVAAAGGTVLVAAGVYHEELTINSRQRVTLKAAQQQAAIIDGAEHVQGWRLLDEGKNVWGVEFGPAAPYNNDHDRWDMPPRSEQVFVNGRRCTPVKETTAPDAMPEFSFSATLTEPARYVLKLPRGVIPSTALTEITTLTSLLKARADGLVVDGFAFRRARNTYQKAAVTLHGEGIEFLNNLIEYSSAGSGLAIQTKRARVHDNILRHNGQFGFSMGGSGNVVENNLVDGNDLAGYKEWGTGGTKIVGSDNIVRRNRFIGNLGGVAIWLDCGPTGNRIESNFLSGNYGEGIRAEISFHSLIAFNIIEDTRECVPVMFGKVQRPHCIGISVQNSAEICVVNNLLKDNRGAAISLATYNRKAADLAQWQHHDERQMQWLRESRALGLVCAYSNQFFNNVVLQTTPEAAGPCVSIMGMLNEPKPHCYGNQFDYNFYWNSVTHAPKVQMRNRAEVPDGKSEWQTRHGMDQHARGGFTAAAYAQPVFGAEPPYKPTAYFAGLAAGRGLQDLAWRVESDYLGHPLNNVRPPLMGPIQPEK
ncbi:MAG: right-handed parallel beta-helix repeat-containing protein [Kiritimatiellaeota bacterium]|nr:right-handed parallel beta-helix repeat-containing protein [Kiritimatiellota bacterium]